MGASLLRAVSCLADLHPGDVMPPLMAYYAMRRGGTLPLLPYAAPGDSSLGGRESVARDHAALLMANHGPVASGSDLAAAADAAEELGETARLFLLLHGRDVRPPTAARPADLAARWPRS